jgi:hypothetical protein
MLSARAGDRRVLSDLAGRLITGPFAFLLAGLLDVGAFLLAVAWHSLARRLGRARR